MKRAKDRLHSVMVIGATPSGVAATNKLGELGIPVILVESEVDLNKKFSREEWRLPTGITFNYAHRSGLIRILRNPRINTILPAKVTYIRHTPQGFRARVKKENTYVDEDRCILCGRCLLECPVTTPEGTKPIEFNSRGSLPGRVSIKKRKTPLCQENCPLGVNVQGYIALSMAKRFREALALVRRDNILPGICGRVCTHPCEKACRRGDLDEPLAIKDIKRYLADYELSHPHKLPDPVLNKDGEKIAVIGSGPAGLAAAVDLHRLGYQVTVFEKEKMAGGLLRYGIGPHRLPREILDYELEYIRKLGVTIRTSSPVDLSGDFNELKKEFRAVVLATGAHNGIDLGIPGEESLDVCQGIDFLRECNLKGRVACGNRIAVVGGGNAAIDVARSALRLGAQEVTLIYRRTRAEMPAWEEEIKAAEEEGVKILYLTTPREILIEDGKVSGLRCIRMELGEPDSSGRRRPIISPGKDSFDLKFDRVFVAIGQSGPFLNRGSMMKTDISERGFIKVDKSLRTNIPDVYAAGDVTTGPTSVVDAMACGRALAKYVHSDISGESVLSRLNTRPEDLDFIDIPKDLPSMARPIMPERQPGSRKDDFSEVAIGLTEAQVLSEAERCLQCGICSECMLCVDACKRIGAINHEEKTEESIEQAGVVIIADPEICPSIKGEDVIRAYGPKTAKTNVNDMITRGFAAAANAMVLLRRSSQRLRGHGVAFAPPDPGLSPEVRLGVFVCRCNDSLGWSKEMEDYVNSLTGKEGLIHAEFLDAACVTEGSNNIVRKIREKGITRVVLASCVCCPLDFVCSACTDQRSRLKSALFNGTGISRSMIETCNLRGEALSYFMHDKEDALRRFTGLLERSIQRARRVKPLPSPMRTYNFATAVIGDSEASENSARTLAEAGFEVLLFGSSGRYSPEKFFSPNIRFFDKAMVRGLGGSLGDFKIFLVSDDLPEVLQVGTIILGERSRRTVPYILQEGFQKRIVTSSMQKEGVTGIPFLYPGRTSIAGLFISNPPDVKVSDRRKGLAAAVLAAAVMPRGPRQSKGYTVVVDKDLCRGCGRCINVCPYNAISFQRNNVDGWYAMVDEALCKGCGNCISVCPTNAADSPYRDKIYLEQLIEEVIRA
ncbi:MAG: FAD-dependent oxidoreductase [Deltaproteobacteria bacterium]|nr:FAD-dependent oxidoreductase [Deltaproteobacteria bacterium]